MFPRRDGRQGGLRRPRPQPRVRGRVRRGVHLHVLQEEVAVRRPRPRPHPRPEVCEARQVVPAVPGHRRETRGGRR